MSAWHEDQGVSDDAEARGLEALSEDQKRLGDDVDLTQAACFLEEEFAAPDRELIAKRCSRVRRGKLLSPDERKRLRALIASA